MSAGSGDAAFFLGVDGGGSRCRVRLSDAAGLVFAEIEGGAANVSLDFDRALSTIRASVATALRAGGVAAVDVAVGLGLAGVSSPSVAARVRSALPGFHRVVVRNDGITACLGAHGGQDGGIVIAGTGSVAVLLVHGRETTFGGRGFLMGDDGSGAVLGREIWRKALRSHDGLEPSTPLLLHLLEAFEHDPVAIIAWARCAPSHDFARYAPQVFAAAGEGDPAACEVVDGAARAIAELIESLCRRGASRISLMGGLAEVLVPWLPAHVRTRLSPPLADALDGALRLASEPISPLVLS